jgi:LEA14-like dessication related protein
MPLVAWRQVAWSLLLGGCTPLGLWLYEDPVVTVSRITFEMRRSEPRRSPVMVALALQNRNDYPLSTERVELSLRLDGVPIGRLERDSTVPMATDTVSAVALPLALTRQMTPEELRKLGSGTHTFRVQGRATFRTPIGSRKVNFTHEGSLIMGTRSNGSSW